MGARTLEQIAAASGAPSWTTGSEVESFVRFISSHGPYKTEVLLFQNLTSNDFTADDTFKSQLAHPLWVTVQKTTDADDASTLHPSAEVDSLESSSTFKTITLRDAEDDDGIGIMITVYGF